MTSTNSSRVAPLAGFDRCTMAEDKENRAAENLQGILQRYMEIKGLDGIGDAQLDDVETQRCTGSEI